MGRWIWKSRSNGVTALSSMGRLLIWPCMMRGGKEERGAGGPGCRKGEQGERAEGVARVRAAGAGCTLQGRGTGFEDQSPAFCFPAPHLAWLPTRSQFSPRTVGW